MSTFKFSFKTPQEVLNAMDAAIPVELLFLLNNEQCEIDDEDIDPEYETYDCIRFEGDKSTIKLWDVPKKFLEKVG